MRLLKIQKIISFTYMLLIVPSYCIQIMIFAACFRKVCAVLTWFSGKLGTYHPGILTLSGIFIRTYFSNNSEPSQTFNVWLSLLVILL